MREGPIVFEEMALYEESPQSHQKYETMQRC